MNLWIISQDRKKYIPNPKLEIKEYKKEFYIMDLTNNNKINLGKYKTLDIAISVLNKIYHTMSVEFKQNIYFIMPDKDGV